jgi:hypothetical protein
VLQTAALPVSYTGHYYKTLAPDVGFDPTSSVLETDILATELIRYVRLFIQQILTVVN